MLLTPDTSSLTAAPDLHCHLVIAALIPPADAAEEFLAGAQAPALARLIARAGTMQSIADGYEAWWCTRHRVARQNDWPLAPITFAADGGAPGNAFWLRADPVHLQVNRDQLVLADSSQFAIDAKEARELVAALNAHFGRDGLIFHAPHPTRWYLRLPAAADLRCTSLANAAGKSIDPLLPAGADAGRFRSLCNEAQMLLFSHPVNQAREMIGELPVNSIWLWGGGIMPLLQLSQAPPASTLWTSDPIARAFGLTHPCIELPADAPEWLSQTRGSHDHLIAIDALRTPYQYGNAAAWQERLAAIDRDWIAPLIIALQAGRIERLRMTAFGNGKGFSATVMRRDLWKFWRGTGSVASVLTP